MFGQDDNKKHDDEDKITVNNGFGVPSDTPPMPPSGSPGSSSSDPIVSVPSVGSVQDHGNLLDLKQDALKDLMPLVSQLDQTPEEKFKTTMMMIQATDNPDMIKDAYEAAKAIPAEKVRAQALLDVVNEINYFTHQNEAK
jgi:hypothetical protein